MVLEKYLLKMKMNYHPSNNKNKKTKLITVTAVLVLMVLTYLYGGTISRVMSNSTHGMFASVLKIGETTKQRISIIPTFFNSHVSLQNENDRLKEQIQELEIQNLVSKYILNENEKLQEILNRPDERQVTLAAIIARPNQSLYDTLIIDVGDDNGIKEDDTVVANGSISIGRVAEVYDKSSKVVLFSSTSEEVNVLIGEQNISATAIGRNGGNFEIRFPRDTEISIGDTVSAPSMNIEILGIVAYIQKEPNDPFQVVLIQSPVNIYELKFVEVIKSYNDDFVESEE